MSKDWGNLPYTVQSYQQRFTALAMQRSIGVFKQRVSTAAALTMAPPHPAPLPVIPCWWCPLLALSIPFSLFLDPAVSFISTRKPPCPATGKSSSISIWGVCTISLVTPTCAFTRTRHAFPWTIHSGHAHSLQPHWDKHFRHNSEGTASPRLPCTELVCSLPDTFPLGLTQENSTESSNEARKRVTRAMAARSVHTMSWFC